ncbi:MAG: chemotaxis protein CheW [Steroidobacteraceae bacterium]
MDASVDPLVVFFLDERRFALRLANVERIIPILDITPLPKAPDVVLGVINVRGSVYPVVDIRSRFALPTREPLLSDHLMLARTSNRALALIVDQVAGVDTHPRAAITATRGLYHALEYVSGVLKLDDGLILIHDLNSFLSPDEDWILAGALRSA